MRILSCIGEGYTHKEIAHEFGVSIKTVGYHITSIYKILRMNSTSQLVRAAIGFGLCSPLCLLLLLAPRAAAAQPFLVVSNPSPVVMLAWDPPVPPTTVSFYRVYYGTASRSYTTVTNVGTATNITITLSTRGATYFFAVTDTDSTGLQSPFSNEVTFTPALPPNPPTMKPITVLTVMKSSKPDGVFADAGMNWSDTPDQPQTYYKLKIDRGIALAAVSPPMPHR